MTKPKIKMSLKCHFVMAFCHPAEYVVEIVVEKMSNLNASVYLHVLR